jgi:hypothetical protein
MGLSVETWGIILAVLGVALTLYFGIKAVTHVRSKRISQK